ncbi:MAG: glycosyltransferase family 1 protein [Bacilli bacterium]|nr:glycosyltransferase family 1 protein [Bacilli bacterium]
MNKKLSKLANVYKKYGFVGFMKKLYAYIKANYLDKISFDVFFHKKKYQKIISEILAQDYDRIILWRSSFGYKVPLFQRPQHISNQLSKHNCLVLYEVTTMTDKVKTVKKQADHLYLFNFNNLALNKILMNELVKIKKPKYFQLYSTDWKLSIRDIENYMQQGFGFIYEYVDHISPDLSGTKELPQNISDKYEFAMSHKEVIVVVTADALKEDVVKKRGEENLVFSSNGVDYHFFREIDDTYQFEEEFQKVLEKKKPIVCYYGALAKWFDYELLKKIAATNQYSVVLFGIKYDGSYDENMGQIENVYFLGPRDYKVLKNYADKADVLILPFLLNDITKSTSPCKLFEYMSLHKPIVTTDLLECRKYESVMIGKTHKEFLEKLEEAIKNKNDKKYIDLLDKEARENDWSKKAEVMIQLLKEQEYKQK